MGVILKISHLALPIDDLCLLTSGFVKLPYFRPCIS